MLWRCLSLLTRWDTNISNPAHIQVPVFYMSGDRDRKTEEKNLSKNIKHHVVFYVNYVTMCITIL